MSLDQFRSIVPRLVRCQDPDLITPQDVDRVLQSALRQYSSDAPRELVRDVTWGAEPYMVDAPVDLVTDSRILQAEYPIGRVPAQTLNISLAVLPPGGPGDLALVSDQPVAQNGAVRLTFTAPHTLSSETDSVPAGHADALGYFAAHLLCRELASYYSGERESSIGADQSQTEGRARNYAQRAKEYRAAYFAALGMLDPMGGAAGGSGAGAGSSGGAAPGAGAVASWPSRSRASFRTTDTQV